MLKVLYYRARFGGAQISPSAGAAKNSAFFVPKLVVMATSLKPITH